MNKKANWITITLNKGKFDKTALGIIGLPVTEPSEANKNVMRWDKFEGVKELDLFSKLDGTIDYFYIKVLNAIVRYFFRGKQKSVADLGL
jgi:hypothetical protein